MNTLRLGNINLHAPYKVLQDPDKHNIYERRHLFFLKTAEGKMDGIMNFLAIISRRDNPRLTQAIEEFDETISFLFDPPEEFA